MVYKGYSVVYEGFQGCTAVQEDCRGPYGCVMVWLQIPLRTSPWSGNFSPSAFTIDL